MTDCPFCRRVAEGDYEGKRTRGGTEVVWFAPLNPVTEGHMLFLPMRHHGHPSPGVTGAVMSVAADEAYFRLHDAYNLITSAGQAATQTVEHLHVHLVPRRENDGLPLPWTPQQEAQ